MFCWSSVTVKGNVLCDFLCLHMMFILKPRYIKTKKHKKKHWYTYYNKQIYSHLNLNDSMMD